MTAGLNEGTISFLGIGTLGLTAPDKGRGEEFCAGTSGEGRKTTRWLRLRFYIVDSIVGHHRIHGVLQEGMLSGIGLSFPGTEEPGISGDGHSCQNR